MYKAKKTFNFSSAFTDIFFRRKPKMDENPESFNLNNRKFLTEIKIFSKKKYFSSAFTDIFFQGNRRRRGKPLKKKYSSTVTAPSRPQPPPSCPCTTRWTREWRREERWFERTRWTSPWRCSNRSRSIRGMLRTKSERFECSFLL